jgi:anti-sigma factor (TIGR02949 family)
VISCGEAVRQLWEYLEGELRAGERGRVEEHLAFCRRCCGEVEFAEALQQILRSAARPHLPADVEARLDVVLASLDLAPLDTEPT